MRSLSTTISLIVKQADSFNGEILRLAAKERMSRKQMLKNLERTKGNYKGLKSHLDELEAFDSKTKQDLEITRTDLDKAKKFITKVHKALESMDLSDANDAVFYDDDIGYIIDGKEYHMEDDGKLTPMREHRKAAKPADADDCDADDSNDLLKILEE